MSSPAPPADVACRAADVLDDPAIPWILCIDDDEDFSWGLKRRLERYGLAVVRSWEGTDGVLSALTRPANLVLLDYNLPNGQGDYVLGRLKDNPITRDIPVIVLTGERDAALRRKMYNLGAAAYFNKPVDFAELVEEIRRHVALLEPRP
jgi:DNA-binding response OmpR family regulator